MPFNDFRSEAAWKPTRAIPTMSKESNPCKHPVRRTPGVMFETVCIDTPHVLDQGVSQHCAANLFVDLVNDLDGSRKPARQAATRGADALQSTGYHCNMGTPVRWLRGPKPRVKALCRMQPLTLSSPGLHGWKAREMRYLVPACEVLAKRYSQGTLFSLHRLALFSHFTSTCDAV